MCSNPCESEVTCFRPESNRGPYGLLNFFSAALSTTELWWRINLWKSFRTLYDEDSQINEAGILKGICLLAHIPAYKVAIFTGKTHRILGTEDVEGATLLLWERVGEIDSGNNGPIPGKISKETKNDPRYIRVALHRLPGLNITRRMKRRLTSIVV